MQHGVPERGQLASLLRKQELLKIFDCELARNDCFCTIDASVGRKFFLFLCPHVITIRASVPRSFMHSALFCEPLKTVFWGDFNCLFNAKGRSGSKVEADPSMRILKSALQSWNLVYAALKKE